MRTSYCTIILILVQSICCFLMKRPTFTSPCNVIGDFEAAPKLRQIGKQRWKKVCERGRYVQAVWSQNTREPFLKAKCCGKHVNDSYSWEIRDVSFYSGGSSKVNERWNIECDKYSVITGFRFVASKQNVRSLSSVRCSILVNKVINKEQCVLLNFDTPPDDESKLKYNIRWQHQCPNGYALVGLYDQSKFQKIEKAKCCIIEDSSMRVNQTINFDINLGGFEQSSTDNYNFKATGNGYLESQTYTNLNLSPVMRGVLISPGVFNKTLCLEMNVTQAGGKMKQMLNSFAIILKGLKKDYIIEEVTQFVRNIPSTFIVLLPIKEIAQLSIEVGIARGYVQILGIRFLNPITCKADECSNIPRFGCAESEDCRPLFNGFNRCFCDPKKGLQKHNDGRCLCDAKKGFIKAAGGGCINGLIPTPPSTTHRQIGPDFKDKTTSHLGTTKKSITENIISNSKTTVGDLQKVNIKSDHLDTKWMFGIFGATATITLAVVGIGLYLCICRSASRKKRRNSRKSFLINQMENQLGNMRQISSSDTINSRYAPSTMPIYIPYMNNMGYIENIPSTIHMAETSLTTPAKQMIPINESPPKDPVYTKIKRRRGAESFNEDEVPSSSSPAYTPHYSEIEKEEEAKEIEEMLSISAERRPSTMTLFHPDYGNGESDEENEDEYYNTTFCIPPDDEEEILDDLKELPRDSVEISSKVLGTGAFGLVKLGELISVNGVTEVAVKIMKKRESHDEKVNQEERIKFYQEAAIMSQFDHPNVIALFGVIVGVSPCMVLEYLARGSLWKYLNKIQRLRKKEGLTEIKRELHCMFLKMARNIAAGMAYLAALKFVHRDLATRNILLDSKLTCKIADFGLSRHFMKDEQYYKSHGGQIPIKWTAPEALEYKKYSTKSDVWSFGIVLWEIWSVGKLPYGSWKVERVMKEVCEGNYRLPEPDGVPQCIYNLMSDCWLADKDQRPTFNQIEFCLNHTDDRILGKNKKDKPPVDHPLSFTNKVTGIQTEMEHYVSETTHVH